ncbi:MAG TPA: alpha/beta hydrolase, partial [Chitinophagaceae bacterium]|nr:alpha/beta hydrolase [Chitinophagaceae bacterium]
MSRPVRKYRWFRRLLRITGVLIILFIIACFIFDHYVQFRKSDKELKKIFAERNLDATINYYSTQGRTLRYLASGNDSLPTLLILHGSPGSISYYGARLADTAIRNKFRVYAVDRPGYGYSGFGDPEPSIQKQSEMIRPILDSLNKATHPIIIMGGSYGSSVACRLAMDHPELVDGLILTGPSLGPGLEKYFWFTPVIENPAIRWFMPRLFKSANTEKVHHKKELEKMLPYWTNIKVPVIYVQGENDHIIDTSNASFARQHLVNVPSLDIKFVKNRGHRLAQFEWPLLREC